MTEVTARAGLPARRRPLGAAVWESSRPGWLRALLVGWFAAGWTLVSLPRAKA